MPCLAAARYRRHSPRRKAQQSPTWKVRSKRRPGLPDDDGCQAAGRRLRPDGLPGWPRRVDAVYPGFDKWTYGQDPNQSPTSRRQPGQPHRYWLTNTATSAARIYSENRDQQLVSAASQRTDQITVPVAITVFPDEVFRAQERWARSAFRNLIYFHEADRGGHFAMWERPSCSPANSVPHSDQCAAHSRDQRLIRSRSGYRGGRSHDPVGAPPLS